MLQQPSVSHDDNIEPRITLEHWFPRKNGSVSGQVYGHPDWLSGSKISVQPLHFMHLWELDTGKRLTTESTVYLLGVPHEDSHLEEEGWLDAMKSFPKSSASRTGTRATDTSRPHRSLED